MKLSPNKLIIQPLLFLLEDPLGPLAFYLSANRHVGGVKYEKGL